jgi:hypothetical protein
MPGHDVLGCQPRGRGHGLEIGAGLSAVLDGHVDGRPLAGTWRRGRQGEQVGRQRIEIRLQRVEEHRHGAEGRQDVVDAGRRFGP